MPSSNYAVYAGLFIMALAIERLLEPFSGLFIPSTKTQKAKSVASQNHAKRVTQAHLQETALHAAAHGLPSAGPGCRCADGRRRRKRRRRTDSRRSGPCSCGRPPPCWQWWPVLRSEFFSCAPSRRRRTSVVPPRRRKRLPHRRLPPLTRTERTNPPAPAADPNRAPDPPKAPTPARDPNRVLDLLATGLVVGAGTKPLHDLITQIQTSSSKSKSSANSSTSGNAPGRHARPRGTPPSWQPCGQTQAERQMGGRPRAVRPAGCRRRR